MRNNRNGWIVLAALGGILAACDNPPEQNAVFERSVNVQTPAGAFTMRVTGPRELSDQEIERLRPVVQPLGSEAGGGPTQLISSGQPKQDAVPDGAPIDLSGFTIEFTPMAGGTRSGADGVGSITQALSGSVSGVKIPASGYVSQGGSVTYTVNGVISDGILQPLNNDGDLYSQNCNGSIISSSTWGGTTADFLGIYNAGGSSTCRQFRVYGYRATNYNLNIFNYY